MSRLNNRPCNKFQLTPNYQAAFGKNPNIKNLIGNGDQTLHPPNVETRQPVQNPTNGVVIQDQLFQRGY